jgi:hypothetical protein
MRLRALSPTRRGFVQEDLEFIHIAVVRDKFE